MGSLIADLVPEMAGLFVTPAAIAGCVLLLQSRQGLRNALIFAAAFLAVYVEVIIAALIGGASGPTSTTRPASHWISVVVGVLFLIAGVVTWVRTDPRSGEAPKWMVGLENASPRRAGLVGIALGILNPNLLIMLSGISIVASEDSGTGASILGVLLLLLAAALDFILPIGIYLALGERAHPVLSRMKQWLIRYNQAFTIAVLLVFGALFTVRGTVDLV